MPQRQGPGPGLSASHREAYILVSHEYTGAESIMKALERASVRELMTFEGGSAPISEPCEASSAHGYLGLEPQVVSAIAAWIRAH